MPRYHAPEGITDITRVFKCSYGIFYSSCCRLIINVSRRPEDIRARDATDILCGTITCLDQRLQLLPVALSGAALYIIIERRIGGNQGAGTCTTREGCGVNQVRVR